MTAVPKCFVRLLSPNAVLSHELNQQVISFITMSDERSELDNAITTLRKQQEDTENNLSESLAEDEFQGALRGQPVTGPNEEEMQVIFKQHLGRLIEKLASKYERLVLLDADIRKLKSTIEKGIAVVNEQAAAAAADTSM